MSAASSTIWDLRFCSLALNEISTWSKDPSSKVGAVLVSPDRRQIIPGYNGFPRGIADDSRLHNRDIKYNMVIHAEENAILTAARDLTGYTMYCTHKPCPTCTAKIIQVGVSRIVGIYQDDYELRWKEKLQTSIDLMNEASIPYIEIHPGSIRNFQDPHK